MSVRKDRRFTQRRKERTDILVCPLKQAGMLVLLVGKNAGCCYFAGGRSITNVI